MYKTFKVRNFRGLRKLDIDSLSRVNLIAGKNNVGKTALLEALWLHSGPNAPRLGAVVNDFRGLQNPNMREVFHGIFRNFDPDAGIELIASGDWGRNDRLLHISLAKSDRSQVTFTDVGAAELQRRGITPGISNDRIVMEYIDENSESFESDAWMIGAHMGGSMQSIGIEERQAKIENRSVAFYLRSLHRPNPTEDAERFSNLLVTRRHRKVESMMKRVEPRLQSLSVTAHAPAPTIHAELEGQERLLPMPLLGDGITRLLSLALAIGSSTAEGITLILIDEIENGLHHSVMQSVWSGIAQFAREFDVQIFATTHSWECIHAAHKAFSEDELYDFRLHRLDRIGDDDDIKAVTYDQETLEAALEMEFEVR